MDFALTETQKLLQNTTRRFAEATLSRGVREREELHDIPHDIIRSLGQHGLLGINVGEDVGGSALGPIAYVLALREIAARDASVGVTMAVTNMVGEIIDRFGSDEQRRNYLPSLVSGEFFGGSFALSEPHAGSDAAALRTRAERRGTGWVLRGEKMWITTGDRAGVIVVWARTSDEGARGITCFLVDRNAKGVSCGAPEKKLGLRASHTVALSFQDVVLDDNARLGEIGHGFKIAMMALDGGRIGISSQAVGMADRALRLALAHIKERQQFNQTLAELQAIQFKIADMSVALESSWLLTLRAAWLKEHKRPFSKEAAMCKVTATENANFIVREAVQLLGGYGYMEESEVARLLRDCRVTQIYEGTSEIQRLVIARELLRATS